MSLVASRPASQGGIKTATVRGFAYIRFLNATKGFSITSGRAPDKILFRKPLHREDHEIAYMCFAYTGALPLSAFEAWAGTEILNPGGRTKEQSQLKGSTSPRPSPRRRGGIVGCPLEIPATGFAGRACAQPEATEILNPGGRTKEQSQLKRSTSPRPSPPRRGGIVGCPLEIPATGFAGRACAQPDGCDGCSFSQGEKVRMRASQKSKVS
jgi:hypothetical protein